MFDVLFSPHLFDGVELTARKIQNLCSIRKMCEIFNEKNRSNLPLTHRELTENWKLGIIFGTQSASRFIFFRFDQISPFCCSMQNGIHITNKQKTAGCCKLQSFLLKPKNMLSYSRRGHSDGSKKKKLC